VATIVVTLAIMRIGVEPLFALGYGLLAGATVLLTLLRGAGSGVPPSPHHRVEPVARGSEISRLAWGFNPRTQLAGEIVARRARAVLRRRLARAGIDADAQPDRVDEILGPGVWERLSTRKASAADIDRAFAATDPDKQESS
jgi:hypothetical protein